MNRPLPAFLLLVCAAAFPAAAQDLSGDMATLGIKELAYEVPHFLRVGGGGTNSYELGTGGDVYRVYSTGGGISAVVGGDIYVINAKDVKPRLLVSEASRPSWSPDGSQLAYCSWNGLGLGQIDVVNADGTGRRQLTNMKGGACFPDWSPDGTEIVFTALSAGDKEKNLRDARNTDIFVVDKNGGDPVRVTTGYAARWSPGGKLLILLRRSDQKGVDGSIWLATPGGKQARMVAVSDRPMEGAAWLPDGRGILASYMLDGDYSVFRSYLDGSQQRGASPEKLGGEARTDWSWPAVSPDGKEMMAVVVGCPSDKHVELPANTSCSNRRIELVDLASNKKVVFGAGTSYSVVWDKK